MASYLITGIGGDIAQGVSQILRSYDADGFFVGSDISTQHAGSLFVDDLAIVPPAKEVREYLKALSDLIAKFKFDFFIPTSEPELEAISSNIHLFDDVVIIYPGAKVVETCVDKYLTNKFLSSIDMPAPWTYTKDERSSITYPCIFKSRKGAGSKILFTVKDEEEALFLAKKFPDSIFQELLLPHDSEITCGVFRSSRNDISVIQFQRVLTEGTTSWAKTVCNEDVETMCKYVAERLELTGSMNIQLRLTEFGPRIFEINPRFSSTICMRHQLGFEDLIWSIKDAIGIEFQYPSIPSGIECVRTQKAEVLNFNKN